MQDRLNQDLAKYLPGAVHYNFAFPWDKPGIHIVKANGHFVESSDGNTYLDFFSKFGASILGHGNSHYTQLLADRIVNKPTAIDHFGTDEVLIINKLVSAVPGADKVRFSLSGTEAVFNALRAARAYTGKNTVIRFQGHYHGSSDSILGGTSSKPSYVPIELVDDQRGTAGRAKHAFGDSLILPWNDKEALDTVIKQVGNDVAAVIMEPVCINGGGISPNKAFMKHLKSLSKKYQFLIVFDEIITGFRFGYGSAQEFTGIQPDIWVFGKAIGGGSLPVSCFMASNEIMDVYSAKKVTHGGTFNGYPMGLYAIDATLSILSKPNAYKQAIDNSNDIKQLITNAAQERGIDVTLQGHPMALCLHASAHPLTELSEWNNEMKHKEGIIREAFLSEGIIVAPPCRLYPSISFDTQVVDELKSRLPGVFKLAKEGYITHGYKR